MKTQQLKILAQQATPWPWKWFTSNSHKRLSSVASGKDGDVISAFKAADGAACVSISQDNMAFIEAAHPGAVIELIERLEAADKDGREYAILAGTNAARAEKAERERDELRKTLQATQGGATEAIKNVMRLQEEISRLDKESQRLSDQLGACDRQRFDWLKRALTAEAEIARRDAAAGEPVVIMSVSKNSSDDFQFEIQKRLADGVYELYTVAPPAPSVPDDYFSRLVSKARQSAEKAMIKFPQPNYVLLKVAEEAGEVVQAGVHYAEGRETWENLEGEVVQTMAMLYRLVTEGDQVNGVIPPVAPAPAQGGYGGHQS